MIIDKGKLTALLVHKTGMSKSEVEEQLEKFTKRVQHAADADEEFEIEGFGTFNQKDDNPHFEPAETLQTEINQKYAGMKPIELMGSFKESGAGVSAEESKQPLPKRQHKKPPKKEEPVEPKESVAAKSKKKEALPKKNKTEESVEQPEEKKTAAVSSKPKPKKEKTESSQEEKDIFGMALIAIAIIIALLLLGWLLYSTGVIGTGTANTNRSANRTLAVNEPDPNEKMSNTASISQVTLSPSVVQPSSETNSEKNTVTKTENSEIPVYGLMGKVNPNVKNGYTIIVHSLIDEARARNAKQKLTKEGYRVILRKSTIGGRPHWRVGLGQFKSINKALKAAQTLRSPFKNNHFIKHI